MPASCDPASFDPASFDIVASTGSYGVTIAENALSALLADGGGDGRVVVADAFFAGRLPGGTDAAILLDADEPAKSLDRMMDVIVALRERRATRRTTLVAIGGGVVQDIACFAASIYMRGIDWIYVPTTLLGMTDSCIGGKSSINVGRYKNIVGTFHPPVRVVIDPAVAVTLSGEQVAAGLVEAAKICFCRDPETFARYRALAPRVGCAPASLTAVVALSLRAKKWFVEIDEFDRAERLVLNFGHTFGHAIEAATHFAVSHGIAVGLGMLAALNLGEALGRDYADSGDVTWLRGHLADLVGAVVGIDAILADLSVEAAMAAFQSDKKHGPDTFALILVGEDGMVERRSLPRDDVSADRVAEAFRSLKAGHAHAARRATPPDPAGPPVTAAPLVSVS